jgi:hypothetical protein
VLSPAEISAFIEDGYVALRRAVPAAVAAACTDVVWAALGAQGVLREGGPEGSPPFVAAGTAPPLQEACG